MQTASHTADTAHPIIATQSVPDYAPAAALTPNPEDMRAQLEFLFGGELDGHHEGLIEISDLTQSRLFQTDQIEEAVAFAERMNEQQKNVYVGATLKKPDTARGKRTNLTDVLCATAAWVDCDEEGAANSAKDKWGNLPPSFFMVTGTKPHNRAHFYYRYTTPITDGARIRAVQ